MKIRKLKVVVIGGGNGSAIVLGAVKDFIDRVELSAVISVSDSGGSSGVLRKKFKIVPPADILRAILSLSPYNYRLLKTIFYANRFTHLNKITVKGSVREMTGHNLGNLFLALLADYEGSFMSAVRALEQAVEAQGRVYPATLDSTDISVELANGKIVVGEEAIDRPKYNREWKIKKAWLKPIGRAYPEASVALKAADYIILSPGSLYTSVVAALLPRGIRESIAVSRAKLIYVPGDAYETNGETGPERLSGFVEQIEKYLPRHLDLVIYNNCRLSKRLRWRYHEKKWAQFIKDAAKVKNRKLIGRNFAKPIGGLSSEKLGKVLIKILK